MSGSRMSTPYLGPGVPASGKFLSPKLGRNASRPRVGGDRARRIAFRRKAAEQGYAPGQHSLGYMYMNGRGVAQDDREAAQWFRKAAEQGFASAQTLLGIIYATGRGVAQDDREAVRLYPAPDPAPT